MPRDFVIACGDYVLECTPSGLPAIYDELKRHAALVEELSLHQRELCCLTVRRAGEAWPFLTLAQGCALGVAGLSPAALLVAASRTLFVGYGDRLLAVRLEPVARLWQEPAAGAFQLWEQHGDFVLAVADGALRAWALDGTARWSMPIDPPWSHRVLDDRVEVVDARGRTQAFGLREGPRPASGGTAS